VGKKQIGHADKDSGPVLGGDRMMAVMIERTMGGAMRRTPCSVWTWTYRLTKDGYGTVGG
jgi:hypothetical protein